MFVVIHSAKRACIIHEVKLTRCRSNAFWWFHNNFFVDSFVHHKALGVERLISHSRSQKLFNLSWSQYIRAGFTRSSLRKLRTYFRYRKVIIFYSLQVTTINHKNALHTSCACDKGKNIQVYSSFLFSQLTKPTREVIDLKCSLKYVFSSTFVMRINKLHASNNYNNIDGSNNNNK